MLKLDMAKAFDSVSWPFLIQVLQHRGFGPGWIARIVALISTANTRVLVNSGAGDKFWHTRGLRQGDLLSLALFILMMDVLKMVIQLGGSHVMLSNFGNSGVRHRLSLSADDVVMFIKPVRQEAEASLQLVGAFGMASGLRCNITKSSVTPIRCIEKNLQQITTTQDCPVKHFPVEYLGLPLSPFRLSKTDLQPLVDNCRTHLHMEGIHARAKRKVNFDRLFHRCNHNISHALLGPTAMVLRLC
jgi:hypothetical protein